MPIRTASLWDASRLSGFIAANEQKPGPAVYQLFAGVGAVLPAAVTLSHVDREALREGKLLVRVYSAQGWDVQNIKLMLPNF